MFHSRVSMRGEWGWPVVAAVVLGVAAPAHRYRSRDELGIGCDTSKLARRRVLGRPVRRSHRHLRSAINERVHVGLAEGLPDACGPGRQSDVGREGRARTSSLLRFAPVRQRPAVVRDMSSAGESLHRRLDDERWVDRGGPPAQQHEPRQRRVCGDADLGQPDDDPARGSGARADVRAASDRARVG